MKKTCYTKISPVALAASLICLSSAAHAGEPVDLGNGLTLDWRVSTTYTLATRLKDADPVLSKNAGGNDGDNNFKKGALTSNRVGALIDTKLSKGDSGFVLSGSVFYDDVYHNSNDNTSAVNKPGPRNEFTAEAKRFHGGYARALDAYGFTAFEAGSLGRMTVRAGRHAVSWGEGLFFPGISLAQGPADGTKTGIPGTETKDQLLPEDQISATLELSPRLTLLAHAQYDWHPTLAAAPGSFLSASDGVGPGGSCLGPYSTIPVIPTLFAGFSGCSFGLRGADITPGGGTGQWGLGSRYRVTDSTEVGLYFMNYHDRTPLPEINAFTPGVAIPAPLRPAFGGITQIGNGSYNIRYFDNIKLMGASFNTTLGSVAVAGEISYKEGAPVLVDTVVNPANGATLPTPTRANIVQANLNAFANLGRTPIAGSVLLLGEVAVVQVSDVQARKAPGADAFPANFGFKASDKLSFGDKTAVALSGQVVLGYPGIVEGWDLTVPISVSHQLRGRSILGGVGGEGDTRYSVGATFTKGGNFAVTLNYLGYLGSASLDLPTNRLLTDRDQLSLVMKYAF
jgi:hypothetical protein